MKIEMQPIAYVKNERTEVVDDHWGNSISEIELSPEIIEEAFEGIQDFSHVEIIFYMHQVKPEKAIAQYRHPRNNAALPKLGTFAQRNKNRPNAIGLTAVELIERSGRSIFVRGLDAIDGTPVLDIKPVLREFMPKGDVKQPAWTHEIMKSYW